MDEGRKLDAHISLALDIGMRMLVCGAQISRVEDSIGRICKALGAVETHVFSVTSGIIVTAFMPTETAPPNYGVFTPDRLTLPVWPS